MYYLPIIHTHTHPYILCRIFTNNTVNANALNILWYSDYTNYK